MEMWVQLLEVLVGYNMRPAEWAYLLGEGEGEHKWLPGF